MSKKNKNLEFTEDEALFFINNIFVVRNAILECIDKVVEEKEHYEYSQLKRKLHKYTNDDLFKWVMNSNKIYKEELCEFAFRVGYLTNFSYTRSKNHYYKNRGNNNEDSFDDKGYLHNVKRVFDLLKKLSKQNNLPIKEMAEFYMGKEALHDENLRPKKVFNQFVEAFSI